MKVFLSTINDQERISSFNIHTISSKQVLRIKKVSINPLIPESDQHLISPFNISHESNIKVMRMREMLINQRTSGLLDKFSLSAH